MSRLPSPGDCPVLVEITNPLIKVDLAYAAPHNFTGRVLYPDNRAFLRPETAQALDRAAAAVADLGLRLVLLDAFRPVAVQETLWAIRPDPEFVADPRIGSDHSRGTAVDVTLADQSGHLDMGTGFDVAVPQSHHDREDIAEPARRNRVLLRNAMAQAGFEANPHEWWHYALKQGKSFAIIRTWCFAPVEGQPEWL
jgi:zinc D-Ala-D-Ala dipeptidase